MTWPCRSVAPATSTSPSATTPPTSPAPLSGCCSSGSPRRTEEVLEVVGSDRWNDLRTHIDGLLRHLHDEVPHDPPVLEASTPALERRWDRVLLRGADLAVATRAERHRVRKDTRKLRYGTQFFGSLYAVPPESANQPGSAPHELAARAADLQDTLGELGDLETSHHLLELVDVHGPQVDKALLLDRAGRGSQTPRRAAIRSGAALPGDVPAHVPAVRAGVAFLASRLLLALTVLVMAAVAGQGAVGHEWATGTWWLDRFSAWDSYHFVRIASLGYLPPGLDCCDQAFFPGYPLPMAALAPLTGGNVTGAGLLVCARRRGSSRPCLWRLVADDARGGPVAARRAVLLLALAPCGFFLVAVYTEALFLALALGAWLLAGRRHWWWAGLSPRSPTGVRVNGLFLAAGLAVMYAVQWHHDGRPRRPRATCSPSACPPCASAATSPTCARAPGRGTPGARPRRPGWDRSSLAVGRAGRRLARLLDSPDAWLAASRAADIVAVALGVAVLVLLARQRRWPELTYLALTLGVVLCSTLWVSAPATPSPGSPPTWRSRRCGTRRHTGALYAVGLGLSFVLLLGATWAVAHRQWVA